MSTPRRTIWILGDQLTSAASSLAGVEPGEATVLMVESLARARQRPHHKQKLAFVWAAMRHFADELRSRGFTVDYHAAQPSSRHGLRAHVARHRLRLLRVMDPAEHGAGTRLRALAEAEGLDVEVTPNSMFLADQAWFARWAGTRRTLLLEAFYREMRRRTGLLMDGQQPAGGSWNYDRLNRERPPAGHVFPPVPRCAPDAITTEVLALVARECPDHFGSLADFWLPVTRADAERFADDFFAHRLDGFGPYEDAIVVGERVLYHSLLSPLLNVGLLDPLDVCRRAEACYRDGSARLNSVEGFIRQVIGWREFVRLVYHLDMPGYARQNHLGADLPLPAFYWDGDTDMRCVADAVGTVRQWGLNHHIQRLMITGNFALIAGLDPQAVTDWYRLAYVDAFDWVVTPNVLGLSLFADGGRIATKPYAAAANYIDRMSDCCRGCAYDRRESVGDAACPFNALYWDFLARCRERLGDTPRLRLMLAGYERRPAAVRRAISARATALRERLRRGERL